MNSDVSIVDVLVCHRGIHSPISIYPARRWHFVHVTDILSADDVLERSKHSIKSYKEFLSLDTCVFRRNVLEHDTCLT